MGTVRKARIGSARFSLARSGLARLTITPKCLHRKRKGAEDGERAVTVRLDSMIELQLFGFKISVIFLFFTGKIFRSHLLLRTHLLDID